MSCEAGVKKKPIRARERKKNHFNCAKKKEKHKMRSS